MTKIKRLKHTRKVRKRRKDGVVQTYWVGRKPKKRKKYKSKNEIAKKRPARVKHKKKGVKMTNTKPKVFISFDFDNDKFLRNSIVGQAKLSNSPFEMSDWSMKEAAPQRDWEARAKARISRSDMVIVIVGPKTHKASGVLKEIKMARDLNKPIYQVIGYKSGNYTPVPNAGRLYRWNWENLKNLFR